MEKFKLFKEYSRLFVLYLNIFVIEFETFVQVGIVGISIFLEVAEDSTMAGKSLCYSSETYYNGLAMPENVRMPKT